MTKLALFKQNVVFFKFFYLLFGLNNNSLNNWIVEYQILCSQTIKKIKSNNNNKKLIRAQFIKYLTRLKITIIAINLQGKNLHDESAENKNSKNLKYPQNYIWIFNNINQFSRNEENNLSILLIMMMIASHISSKIRAKRIIKTMVEYFSNEIS